MSDATSHVLNILETQQSEVLSDWISLLSSSIANRQDLMSPQELENQCRQFLQLLPHALRADPGMTLTATTWLEIRDLLTKFGKTRTEQGFTLAETATFVFSLKQPLFQQLRQATAEDSDLLFGAIWSATNLLDKLGLYTTEVYLKSREELILRQQHEMLELSTPVVKLWDGILALPLIGTLDSSRTQIIMENLLQAIAETGSPVAIIDITGVPTVDTLVAQHLMRTVAAARLMGADCIISGIRPQIAQTIVHLGIDLGNISTKATLADAFALAIQQTGVSIGRMAVRV